MKQRAQALRPRSPSPIRRHRVVNKGAGPQLSNDSTPAPPTAQARGGERPAVGAASTVDRPPPSPSQAGCAGPSGSQAPPPHGVADEAWQHSPAVRMWAAAADETYPGAVDATAQAGNSSDAEPSDDIRMSELVAALDKANPSCRRAVEAKTQEGTGVYST